MNLFPANRMFFARECSIDFPAELFVRLRRPISISKRITARIVIDIFLDSAAKVSESC